LIGVIAIVVLVVGVIGYGILDSVYLKQIRPVASVDGQKITVRDFEGQVRYQRYQLVNQILQFSQYGEYFASYVEQYQSYLDNPEYLGQQVLDKMVDDLVIAQEAKALGITVSDAEVEQNCRKPSDTFRTAKPPRP